MTFHFTFSLHVKKNFSPFFLTLSLPGPSQRKKRTFLKKIEELLLKKSYYTECGQFFQTQN